jgi:hypothetical protein
MVFLARIWRGGGKKKKAPEKRGLAPELFLVLSTPNSDHLLLKIDENYTDIQGLEVD